jgi:hypothetical protein
MKEKGKIMAGEEKKLWETRHPKLEKFIYRFVKYTLWASVAILTILIILAPSRVDADAPADLHPKSYYTLMYVESILGSIVITLPRKIKENWHVTIPSYMLVPFVIFLYCAIFLGEVRMFYYRVQNWDTFLHFFSAGMLATLAFSIVSLLNQSDRVPLHLTPLFLSIFAFTFAVTCGAIWEIYEFTGDALLGMNMQKWALEDGTALTGQAALADTMKDLITDVIGALVVSVSGYLSMKRYSVKWLNARQLRVDEKKARTDKDHKKEDDRHVQK